MLLDEPTNGLDPAGVAEIRQLIMALARQEGMTVLVSSHILSEIEQMADIVGIICAGRLRYQGPLSGLQDDGVIDVTVSDPAGAAALLDEQRIAHQVRGRTVRIPMLPDEVVGDLVTSIVRSNNTVFRVQTVRKTLEQAFLELTDPLGHRSGPAASAASPMPAPGVRPSMTAPDPTSFPAAASPSPVAVGTGYPTAAPTTRIPTGRGVQR